MCPATLLTNVGTADGHDVRAAAEGARSAGFTEVGAWGNHISELEAAGLHVGVIEAATAWATADTDTAATEARQFAALVARHGAARVAAVCMEPFLDLEHGRRNLAMLVDAVEREGAQVCVEFLPWTGIPDLATAWSLVEPLGPSAGIVLDTWHWQRQPRGPALELLATLPGDRIGYVQLCDAAKEPTGNPSSEAMSSRLLPGEGVVDFTAVISALDAIGAAPFVAIEVFNPALVAELGAGGAAKAMAEAADRVLRRASSDTRCHGY
jgi:sugar phosphate isomerase/epimerase